MKLVFRLNLKYIKGKRLEEMVYAFYEDRSSLYNFRECQQHVSCSKIFDHGVHEQTA